jgi:predicted phosphoribosyltransferase
MAIQIFENRIEAGKQLAEALKDLGNDVVVLAVPRGGVVVGYQVAHKLRAPLDIIIAKKIGAPFNPELAIGAVTEEGTITLDEELTSQMSVSKEYIDNEAKKQKKEIKRRLQAYRGDTPATEIVNRDVIIVDDGVATGSTLRAALISLRKRGAKSVTIAVPVGPPSTINNFKNEADRVVCLLTPEPFFAIGQFYINFDQTSDEEVTMLLKRNRMELQGEEVTA